MDPSTIAEIAKDVVENQLLLNWKFYAIIVTLSLICFISANFLAGYFKERGTNLATKSDFDNLLLQLRKTTETTEIIKQTISHEDWVTREYKVIRRIKLEELMTALYDNNDWFNDQMNSKILRRPVVEKSNRLQHFHVISNLYFPELAQQSRSYCNIFLDAQEWLITSELRLKQICLEPPFNDDYVKELQKITDEHQAISKSFVAPTHAINLSAYKIMDDILSQK